MDSGAPGAAQQPGALDMALRVIEDSSEVVSFTSVFGGGNCSRAT